MGQGGRWGQNLRGPGLTSDMQKPGRARSWETSQLDFEPRRQNFETNTGGKLPNHVFHLSSPAQIPAPVFELSSPSFILQFLAWCGYVYAA